jgi:hypothetical protein
MRSLFGEDSFVGLVLLRDGSWGGYVPNVVLSCKAPEGLKGLT